MSPELPVNDVAERLDETILPNTGGGIVARDDLFHVLSQAGRVTVVSAGPAAKRRALRYLSGSSG
ncbi:MAG: hypothetical protein JO325_17290 [Solirubrobacterales bacterium]|nr:hypothetical protein [Solirubrobacterales bacterium]